MHFYWLLKGVSSIINYVGILCPCVFGSVFRPYSIVDNEMRWFLFGTLSPYPRISTVCSHWWWNPILTLYLICSRVKWKMNWLVAQSHPTLCNPMYCNIGLLCPWNSPGKNTGVDCHSLLQEIFPTQESNPGLLHRG